jgi:glycosyltransferase involved in cell wall biosynthesis
VKVSAIIPFYRHSATITRAVASVWHQSMRPDETIVVNDGSPACDGGLLDHLTVVYPARWLKVIHLETNQGPGKARNVGWQHARGEYVAFLDADDVWHPQKLELQLHWLKRHPEAQGLCTRTQTIACESVMHPFKGNLRPILLRPVDMLLRNAISTRTVVLRRDIEFRFAEHKKNSEDYQLYLTAVLSGCRIYISKVKLAFCFKAEFGENGLSACLDAAHRGHVDSLNIVYRQGLISKQVYRSILLLAQLKHIRRRLIVWLFVNRSRKSEEPIRNANRTNPIYP